MNARQTNIQSLAERARRNTERSEPHPFSIGETYANRQGEYEVMKIAPPKMTIRYEHGGLVTADITILARIWANMQLPPEQPEPGPPGRATTGRPTTQPRAVRTAPQGDP